MRIIGPIPPHILKLMPKEDRKPMGKAGLTNAEAEAKRLARSERELQDNVSNLLRLRGIVFFWQRMDRKTTGIVGQPDFLFAVEGRACAFECKLPGCQPTVEQAEMIMQMERNGWRCFVIRSEAEAKQALNLLEGVDA